MGAILVRGQPQSAATGQTTQTSLTITKPTGVVSGDYLLAQIATMAPAGPPTPSLAGWTALSSPPNARQGSLRVTFLFRRADGTEGASFTFTFTACRAAGGIIALTDVHGSADGIDTFSIESDMVSGQAKALAPDIKPGRDGCMLLYFAASPLIVTATGVFGWNPAWENVSPFTALGLGGNVLAAATCSYLLQEAVESTGAAGGSVQGVSAGDEIQVMRHLIAVRPLERRLAVSFGAESTASPAPAVTENNAMFQTGRIPLLVYVSFGTDPGASPVWSPVGGYVRALSIHRGTSHELDRVEAGTARVSLSNLDRRFDPGNPISPYYPSVLPLRRAKIVAAYGGVAYPRFTGYVESWPQDWPDFKDAVVELALVDGFKPLALQEITATFPRQLSGARVNAVLDAAAWPADERVISAGEVLVPEMTLEATSPLDHLQLVAEAELGRLYCDGAGRMVFKGRNDLTATDPNYASNTWGDIAGEKPYQGITVNYDDMDLWNEVRTSRVGGAEIVAADATSQARYFKRTLSRTGLLVADDDTASGHGAYLLSRFREPKTRISSLEIHPRHQAQWAAVLSKDIGHRIRVRRRPPGVLTAPTQITGCKLWLAARLITGLVNLDPVGSWVDSSGSGNAVTAAGAARPIYRTNIVNGLPIVRFDGTDDVMATAASPTVPKGTVPLTVIAVASRSAAASVRTICGHNSAVVGWAFGRDATVAEARFATRGILDYDQDGGWPAASAFYVTAAVFDAGADVTFWRSGARLGTVAGTSFAADPTTTAFRVGASSLNFFDSDLAELVIFDSALTDGQLKAVVDYLADIYAIKVAGGFNWQHDLFIEGIDEQVAEADWKTTFALSPAFGVADVWTLDDPEFGILGHSTVLGY